jgi:hypothetical protein
VSGLFFLNVDNIKRPFPSFPVPGYSLTPWPLIFIALMFLDERNRRERIFVDQKARMVYKKPAYRRFTDVPARNHEPNSFFIRTLLSSYYTTKY